jgi:hypothetical protein
MSSSKAFFNTEFLINFIVTELEDGLGVFEWEPNKFLTNIEFD